MKALGRFYQDDPVAFVQNWAQTQPPSFYFSHISADQVCAEVRSMLRKHCADYDGMSVVQVYDALPVISQLLTDLYNRVIADRKLPECWKLTLMRPTPKVINLLLNFDLLLFSLFLRKYLNGSPSAS